MYFCELFNFVPENDAGSEFITGGKVQNKIDNSYLQKKKYFFYLLVSFLINKIDNTIKLFAKIFLKFHHTNIRLMLSIIFNLLPLICSNVKI